MASATVSPKPSARLFCSDDGRVPLDRVDDPGVLLQVHHRHARQVHPVPEVAGESLPGCHALGEHLGAFRVVDHAGDVGSDQHQVDVVGDAMPGRSRR